MASSSLDKHEQQTTTSEFTLFKTGVEALLKPILDVLVSGGYSTTDLVGKITSVFTNAVSSGGFFTKNFHTSTGFYEDFFVKEDYNGSIEIAYIYYSVNSKLISGFFMDDSKTSVTYKFKKISFSNLEPLVRWIKN